MPTLPDRRELPLFIGIDPGAGGGMASIFQGEVMAVSMPRTERDIHDWIKAQVEWGRKHHGCFALLEKVWGYIGQGQPGSAMFKFGHGYGFLRGCLVSLQVPFDEVVPREWQKALGVPPRKRTESKTVWKNRLKAKAQQLFPKLHVTLATADALLIAEHCRRTRGGDSWSGRSGGPKSGN